VSPNRRQPRSAGFGAVALAGLLAAPLSQAPQPPTNQSPAAAAAAPAPIDPATSAFTTETGLILITIKPTMVESYELVIRTLQELLAKDTDQARKAATKGWRVFKATETDAKSNVIYVHLLMPAASGFDYRPSLLIDALVKDLAPDLLSKYQDSIAGPPNKLNLTEFAHMAVAPVAPPEVKKPGGR
jgi:hypothetical protein